ncbi:FAD-binding domain-containing protein, partial [Ascodesmis nigricans]
MFTAKTYEDVKKAVSFAAEHNIRLTLLNSGHDFLGRNDAPSGLSLDVSQLAGVRVLSSFTPSAQGAEAPLSEPNVITPGSGQAAVTFGAGVSTQQLNDALAPSNLFTLGAAHGSVKTAGGWGQAGGHAPLSSKYGLGVDQVLEYKVVTADGKLLVANKVVNADLFWALRGGGGSTFGVVVEATVKAYTSPKITVTNWWINATNAAEPDTSVLPAWRKSYVHLIGTGAGAFMADSLRTLAPDTGAYVNEAHFKNPNWKTDFWGTNYERLSEIKSQYDPNGLFWATPGINADHYEVQNGRVCKVTPVDSSMA